MTRVAPVKLKNGYKVLWFDPQDIELEKNDAVVVKTARGTELGYMADNVIEVDDSRIDQLNSPLKPVVRKADGSDLAKAAEMDCKAQEALPVFKEMAAETCKDMHPVSVEYLLDGEHAVFYFEAEDRIDFRELVRKLAARFHVRVDMRQIGVRDEARMVGGIGHCGQELCCKRLGGDFNPVSIRMAKEQDLSLNPQKISGVCGRLMCCLRYEYDAYKDFKSRAPKKNAAIHTPEGTAKVAELNVPREVVVLKSEEGQTVKVPLADFEPAEKGERPSEIGEQAWEKALAPAETSPVLSVFSSAHSLSGKDKLADPAAVRHTHPAAKAKGKAASKDSSASKKGASGQKNQKRDAGDSRKLRRRSKVSSDAKALTSQEQQPAAPQRKKRGRIQLSTGAQRHEHLLDGTGEAKSAAVPQSEKGRVQRSSSSRKPKRRVELAAGEKGAQKASAVRPGRNSSALRHHDDVPARGRGQGGQKRKNTSSPKAQNTNKAPERRTRRRSHKAHGGEDNS